MRAWHFLANNGKLRDGREAPADGVALIHSGPCVCCVSGLHASRRLIDALQYARGTVLCWVDCRDIVSERETQFVCRKRTILKRKDILPVLPLFALWCANRIIDPVARADALRSAQSAVNHVGRFLLASTADSANSFAVDAAIAADEAAAEAVAHCMRAGRSDAESKAQNRKLVALVNEMWRAI